MWDSRAGSDAVITRSAQKIAEDIGVEAPLRETAYAQKHAERTKCPTAGEQPEALAQGGHGCQRDAGGDQRLTGVKLIVMDVESVILAGKAPRPC